MTHYQILMQELTTHGRVTYRELTERYGARGYSYSGFVLAVCRARKRGLVVSSRRDGIARANTCPCCGRPM